MPVETERLREALAPLVESVRELRESVDKLTADVGELTKNVDKLAESVADYAAKRGVEVVKGERELKRLLNSAARARPTA